MRGTPTAVERVLPKPGIIPAYAGNTPERTVSLVASRDHPRVCGEHTGRGDSRGVTQGSSPRMRGTPGTRYHVRHYAGIIPAYAGNTRPPCAPLAKCGDHPRVCGEHVYVTDPDILASGSSPRMRGTPRCQRRLIVEFGIIPAYAGNTTNSAVTRSKTRDHPRVCGEHDMGLLSLP